MLRPLHFIISSLSSWHVHVAAATVAVVSSGAAMPLLPSARGVLSAAQPELRDGDFLVGVHTNGHGAIIRVRAGQAVTFCESQAGRASDAGYFDTPTEVVIDGRGRVLFLAPLETGASVAPWGLWRCERMNEAPMLIAAFGAAEALGYPQPLAGRPVRWAGGLHIKRSAGINLDTGTASTTEWYVMAVSDGPGTHRDTIAYQPDVRRWADDGVLDDPVQSNNNHGFDMLAAGDTLNSYTFSVQGNALKVVAEPVSLGFDLFGVFTIKLAFQHHGTMAGEVVDDLTVANVDTHRCLSDLPGKPLNPHWSAGVMSELYGLAWNEGLLLQTHGGAVGHIYLPQVELVLFNLDPIDDRSAFWLDADCQAHLKLAYTPWHPFLSFNDASGLPRAVQQLTPDGRAGTQRLDGRIVSVGRAQDVTVHLDGLRSFPGTTSPYVDPSGIDVYPGFKPSVGAGSLFIRIDSPVDVLITTADGRRLGVDPMTRLPVNDFGLAGYDSETTEPRVLGIRHPPAGAYSIQAVGTGDGPYKITAFGVNHETSAVTQARFAGTASLGREFRHSLEVSSTGAVIAETPIDTTPPVITPVVSGPAGANGWYLGAVTIDWSVTDPESAPVVAEGCDSRLLPDDTGGEAVVCTARNAAGLESRAEVTVRIDKTAPMLVCPADMTVDALLGQATASVTYAIAASDNFGTPSVSGTPASGVSFPLGRTVVVVQATDEAGNEARCAFNVTVVDVEPPTIAAGENIQTMAVNADGASVTFDLPRATDNSGAVNVECLPASGGVFPIGRTTVACTAADAAGNTAQGHFEVGVLCCEITLGVRPGVARRGQTVWVTATVRNLASTPQYVTLSVELQGPLRTFMTSVPLSLTAGLARSLTLPLRVPPQAPPGAYVVRLRMTTAAGEVTAAATLTVLP